MRTAHLLLLVGILVLSVLSCGQTSNPTAPSQTDQADPVRVMSYIPDDYCSLWETNLMVGQYMDLGTVTVSNNEGYLYFDVALSPEAIADGWQITETHADVYESLDGFPTTKKGNPKVGQFAYSIDSAVSLDENGWVTGDFLYVAVHAALERVVDGVVVQTETGWGEGNQFEGNNWAMWFTYEIGDCCWQNVGLPEDSVTATSYNPGANSYWDTYLSGVLEGHDVGNGVYTAWCVETTVYMTPGVAYTAYLYTSYDPDMPDWAKDIDWPRINYVINHKLGPTWGPVQDAIWYFAGEIAYPTSGYAKDMVDEALAYGGDFHPGFGDSWAIIVEAWAGSTRQQGIFIEVDPCE
jgi:hypothetical protein